MSMDELKSGGEEDKDSLDSHQYSQIFKAPVTNTKIKRKNNDKVGGAGGKVLDMDKLEDKEILNKTKSEIYSEPMSMFGNNSFVLEHISKLKGSQLIKFIVYIKKEFSEQN